MRFSPAIMLSLSTAVGVSALAVSALAGVPVALAAPPAQSTADAVVSLTNTERAKAGCPALKSESHLTQAAQGHSEDMAAGGFMDHNSSKGDPGARIRAAGYKPQTWAENIAAGYTSPSDVVNGWMNSPGHRANILNCGLRDIGVGYAKAGNGTAYWTQDFGTSNRTNDEQPAGEKPTGEKPSDNGGTPGDNGGDKPGDDGGSKPGGDNGGTPGGEQPGQPSGGDPTDCGGDSWDPWGDGSDSGAGDSWDPWGDGSDSKPGNGDTSWDPWGDGSDSNSGGDSSWDPWGDGGESSWDPWASADSGDSTWDPWSNGFDKAAKDFIGQFAGGGRW